VNTVSSRIGPLRHTPIHGSCGPSTYEPFHTYERQLFSDLRAPRAASPRCIRYWHSDRGPPIASQLHYSCPLWVSCCRTATSTHGCCDVRFVSKADIRRLVQIRRSLWANHRTATCSKSALKALAGVAALAGTAGEAAIPAASTAVELISVAATALWPPPSNVRLPHARRASVLLPQWHPF
jgi:hypothetical protein